MSGLFVSRKQKGDSLSERAAADLHPVPLVSLLSGNNFPGETTTEESSNTCGKRISTVDGYKLSKSFFSLKTIPSTLVGTWLVLVAVVSGIALFRSECFTPFGSLTFWFS